MLSNIVTGQPVSAGLRVKVAFARNSRGFALPIFAPVDGAA
jgi:hypothetical protein